MFEYTALVDAPVQRFTSIVTDHDPDELPAAPASATPVVAGTPGGVDAPAARPAAATLPTLAPVAGVDAPPSVAAPRLPSSPMRATDRRAEPAAPPSFLPALIGIAAAGVTAFWWLRRDSHPRGR